MRSVAQQTLFLLSFREGTERMISRRQLVFYYALEPGKEFPFEMFVCSCLFMDELGRKST
jgi:hypothetical protein